MIEPARITKFLGLRNTAAQVNLPLGSLSIANDCLIDDQGTIVLRDGYTQACAATNITASYGTKDHSKMFVIDNGILNTFDGTALNPIATGFTGNPVMWCEESSNLVFAISEGIYIQIEDGTKVTNLNIPIVPAVDITNGVGNLPAMTCGFACQYIHIATGLRGAMSRHTLATTTQGSSLLLNVQPLSGYRVCVYGFFPNSGAWSYLGVTDNFMVISDYPDTFTPALDLYFDKQTVPRNIEAMTFHAGRVCVVSVTPEKTSKIQFSVPMYYHLFESLDESFEIPDLVTGIASVDGKLLICGMKAIWLYGDNQLQRLVNYGTPIGKPIQEMADGSVLIWTNRGVCQFPEFKNLTDQVFSVPAGFGCSTALLEREGAKYFLVSTDDLGQAYNAAYAI